MERTAKERKGQEKKKLIVTIGFDKLKNEIYTNFKCGIKSEQLLFSLKIKETLF